MPTPYYSDDMVTIYHGDCRDILPEIETVDLVLTDPPYGVGEVTHNRANSQRGAAAAKSRDYGEIAWDEETPEAELIQAVIAKGRYAVVWGGNHLGLLPPASCWLVWDKDNGDNGYADCELAWTNLPGAVRRRRHRWMGMLQEHGGKDKEVRYHPTQKPVPVMCWAINSAPEDCKTILDPFMGSGTTLRAALDMGRKSIGIEKEERYCEIAVTRLAQQVMFA